MALSVFGFWERVRLAMVTASIVLCALGGVRSTEGKLDRVGGAIGSSGLAVSICGTGLSGNFGMATLGGDAGGRSSWGRRIGRRIEYTRELVRKGLARGGFACGGLLLVVQLWIA